MKWKKRGGWTSTVLELWDNDVIVARLTYHRWWTSVATIETETGVYELQRHFWSGAVVIAQDGREVARLRLDWRNRGQLTWQEVDYSWRSDNFWGTKWVWQDAAAQVVMRLDLGGGFFRQLAEVEIRHPDLEDGCFLAGLGYYLARQILKDASTAAAIAASAGAASAGT